MDKIKSLTQSRRFYAAVLGIAMLLLHETLGLSQAVAEQLSVVLAAWIIGDSLDKTK